MEEETGPTNSYQSRRWSDDEDMSCDTGEVPSETPGGEEVILAEEG
jgi:hypothetical protein